MVKSVDKAINLLDVLTSSKKPMTLGKLSHDTGIPLSTARRLLLTLMEHRLVNQNDEDSLYSPGFRLFEMAYRVFNDMNLITLSAPILDQLNNETKLTIHLGILEGDKVVYVDKREADRPVRMYSAVGRHAPIHCTALGKALIAFIPDDDLDQIIKKTGLPRHTERTITSRDKLLEDLALIKKRGYSLDIAEQQDMIYCIGAPIRDHKGNVIASISMTTTIYDRRSEKIEKLAPLLIHGANKISSNLGFVSNIESNYNNQ